MRRPARRAPCLCWPAGPREPTRRAGPVLRPPHPDPAAPVPWHRSPTREQPAVREMPAIRGQLPNAPARPVDGIPLRRGQHPQNASPAATGHFERSATGSFRSRNWPRSGGRSRTGLWLRDCACAVPPQRKPCRDVSGSLVAGRGGRYVPPQEHGKPFRNEFQQILREKHYGARREGQGCGAWAGSRGGTEGHHSAGVSFISFRMASATFSVTSRVL